MARSRIIISFSKGTNTRNLSRCLCAWDVYLLQQKLVSCHSLILIFPVKSNYHFTAAQRPNLWKNPVVSLARLPQSNESILTRNGNYVKCFSSTSKGTDNEPKNIKLTSAQKLKKAVTEYGATVIVFHIGISLISLGTSYLLVSTGLDVEQLLIDLNLEDWFKGNTMLVSNAGTFAVAYAIHKLLLPVRITITLGSVPFIVKYLRQKGILKKWDFFLLKGFMLFRVLLNWGLHQNCSKKCLVGL